MIEEVTPDNFEEILNRGEGYIVNVWRGRGAKAHNLAHLHRACRSMMRPTDEYPKFFATTEQAAQDYARAQYNEDCTICQLCG